MSYEVVIPTSGRASLARLLEALGSGPGPLPRRVLVVDDRREPDGPLAVGAPRTELLDLIEVVRGAGRGPAAARNRGWRRARAAWVAFLDDDVLPAPGWRRDLTRDTDSLSGRAAGSQGRIQVPLPGVRRPTDWERNTAGLERARWATADMAYRRSALASVGGFDERFERAYREDADLGLRLIGAGWEIARGERTVLHPVRPAGPLVSVRLQAGNADDVLMAALHGRDWRERAGAPRGRLRRHAAVTAAGLAGAGALAAGSPGAAAAGLGAWLAGTAELAWARVAPGPRTPAEVATMVATSVLIPPAATAQRVRGHLRRARLLADSRRAPHPLPEAVLLDRDGTLIRDVPYNGDPDRVEPVDGAGEAVERLREAGIAMAVISNQSGVGRGLIRAQDVAAVNRRVEEVLGPLGPWLVCPHAPGDGCSCRKPRPGLVLDAAGRLGVRPERCVVIGDIGADVEAAQAAGARAVLVPTPATRPEEVAAAPVMARTLLEAVDHVLGARP
jgi:histidinol-phosphate phosphatase family protein